MLCMGIVRNLLRESLTFALTGSNCSLVFLMIQWEKKHIKDGANGETQASGRQAHSVQVKTKIKYQYVNVN